VANVWRQGDTGRFPHSIWPVVSVEPWFDGQTEERSFVTKISRVMSGHCSIRAHLEQFGIVGDPICVCVMNYETVNNIIWECSRFGTIGTRGHEYKRGNTNPGSLRASKVGSIEVMPQVPKGMWPENMRKSFFYLTLNGLMIEVQRKLEPYNLLAQNILHFYYWNLGFESGPSYIFYRFFRYFFG
jgi:hypothetical protein